MTNQFGLGALKAYVGAAFAVIAMPVATDLVVWLGGVFGPGFAGGPYGEALRTLIAGGIGFVATWVSPNQGTAPMRALAGALADEVQRRSAARPAPPQPTPTTGETA